MDISFDGKRLLAVCGVPSYSIVVWDLEEARRLDGQTSSVPLRSKFIAAKFSPANENLFAVLFENNLVLCEIIPQYEAHAVMEHEIERRIRIQKTNMIAENSKYANFIWDDQNNVRNSYYCFF